MTAYDKYIGIRYKYKDFIEFRDKYSSDYPDNAQNMLYQFVVEWMKTEDAALLDKIVFAMLFTYPYHSGVPSRDAMCVMLSNRRKFLQQRYLRKECDIIVDPTATPSTEDESSYQDSEFLETYGL